jgi:hypothetical protein
MIRWQYGAEDGIKNCCYHIDLKISQKPSEFVGCVQSTWKPLDNNYGALGDYSQRFYVTLKRLWNVTTSIISTPLPLHTSASCRPVFTSKLWNIPDGFFFLYMNRLHMHCLKVEKKAITFSSFWHTPRRNALSQTFGLVVVHARTQHQLRMHKSRSLSSMTIQEADLYT